MSTLWFYPSTMYNMWYLLWHILELWVKATCFYALFGPAFTPYPLFPYFHALFGRAFTPYPLFQWYLQNNETLLNLSMKCWNSTFNAQGWRVIIVVVQVGAVKICVAHQWKRSGKRKERMKLSLAPKLVEKLVWVPVISFCKIFIPSQVFDALFCRNWPFSPPNRVTLWITLLHQNCNLTLHNVIWHEPLPFLSENYFNILFCKLKNIIKKSFMNKKMFCIILLCRNMFK